MASEATQEDQWPTGHSVEEEEVITSDSSTIKLEEIVRDVLDTRPAVMAAKMGATTEFERDQYMRRSLPSRGKSLHDSATSSQHRRSSSLHGRLHRKETVIGRKLNPPSIDTNTSGDVVIADIETESGQDPEHSFQRKKTLRKSSAYLKHRLAEQ